MYIIRKDLSEGTCNFCQRGYDDKKEGLWYPYTEVTHLTAEGSGMTVRVCDNCLKELKAGLWGNEPVYQIKPDTSVPLLKPEYLTEGYDPGLVSKIHKFDKAK